MNLLEVSGISRQEEGVYLLRNISFTQQPFQKIAIAGATGSGKTTLLKIIAGLLKSTEGAVYFHDQRIKGPDEQLIAGHSSIAYLSQYFELRNHYRVEELLEMTNKITQAEANTIFEVCRIDHLLKRWTHQLSGGEKQRIALAKLLVASPKLLLLDEPYSNLDPFHKNTLKDVIDDLSEKLNITCILVSHDPVDALSWADEILILQDGKLIQRGKPAEIYNYPINEYVAELFGKYNLLTTDSPLFINKHVAKRFFRPHDFVLTAKDKGVEGTIINLTYMGSYFETQVDVNGQVLTIATNNPSYSTGDKIYIALVKEVLNDLKPHCPKTNASFNS